MVKIHKEADAREPKFLRATSKALNAVSVRMNPGHVMVILGDRGTHAVPDLLDRMFDEAFEAAKVELARASMAGAKLGREAVRKAK